MSRDRTIHTALTNAGEQPLWDWSRLPIQQRFLTTTHTYSLFSGGFGNGKTTVLCAKVILLLLGIPNNLGFLGRMDGKSLRASTMQTLREMLPAEYVSKWNDQQGFLQVAPEYGGSKLIYGDFKDVRDFKNVPLGFFAIDQCEETPADIWDFLAGRLRRRTPVLNDVGQRQFWVLGSCPKDERHYACDGDERCQLCGESLPPMSETVAPGQRYPTWDCIVYNRYGFAVANPEGPSHWLYKLFPGLPGVHGASPGNGDPEYTAFHATIYDGLNAGFIDRKYVEDLERKYAHQPVMRDRYLLGIWVEAEGLVYPGWQRGVHVLPRRAHRHDGRPLIDDGTTVYEYVDHGLTAPTAVGWVAVRRCDCGCGKLDYYILDEHYEGGKTVYYHAQAIKQHRERLGAIKLGSTYLDSQAFSKTLMGSKGEPKENELYSVADVYIENDIFPVPNQKDWDLGYDHISALLEPDPDHVHPTSGHKGAPHLYVLGHCTHFIDEIEGYKWKVVRNQSGPVQKEEPRDGNDHHMDGLNGFLASRPSEQADVHIIDPNEEPAWVKDLRDEITPTFSHMGA